ncbi:histidinol-phosphate transaminase [Cohnella sp. AR92]|uniref:histidinol-phosphate transaminase n=1 Tax=Cohnella sp. AR92 TaxID=648716 RepID=UPI000F8EBC10|nr:histidinol-phosphate transaminase [Cohnella sp. AR92]RUS46197.1 histidinol-phosphate transaminase [Cohnella sp. AR92]
MTRSTLWRQEVTKLEAYVPGKSIEEVQKQYGLSEITRLASNENPYGPSPKAIDAMNAAAADSHLYPEPTSAELRGKLGTLYGVDPSQVLVSNGADNVLMLIGQAYVNPGDEVVYCVPTFSVYRTSTVVMGGVPIEVPLTGDYKFDLDGMLAAVTERTKLIYLCNPNNPTGTIVDCAALEEFLKKVPPRVVVVLDEAYGEFIDVPSYKTGAEYVREGYPVISVHTFSKLYGLAAMRVGYAIANPDVLAPVLAVREPFPVSRMANSAAAASLDDTEYREFILRTNREGLAYLSEQLRQMNVGVNPSYSNFLFADLHRDAAPVVEALMKAGYIVRPCKSWGYPEHIRITVGSPDQNKGFIEALRTILEA